MSSDFRNLRVWKKSMELAVFVYKIARGFGKEEVYGLTSQIKRAVVSISGNVSEGCGKKSSKDFSRFLYQRTLENSIIKNNMG